MRPEDNDSEGPSPVDLERARSGAKNLRGADLYRADLSGVVLRGVDLFNADLTNATLVETDFSKANLIEAQLEFAVMHKAVLNNARLSKAQMPGAQLLSAKLRGAEMHSTNLHAADLREADLTKAVLVKAVLLEATLVGTVLKGANLNGADLRDAILNDADLSNADLRNADLTGADLQNVIYNKSTQWPAGFKFPETKTYTARAYGKLTGPILKLSKPDVDYRAKQFSKKHPQDFQRLQPLIGGGNFTPEFVSQLRAAQQTPLDWIISEGKYTPRTQRACTKPNLVLKLNINLADKRFANIERELLTLLAKASFKPGHPKEAPPLLTIGWVRICCDDVNGVWLIEEVQSDLAIVNKNYKKYAELPAALRDQIEKVTELLQPFAARFYEDAVGLVFIEAEKRGYVVEMLTYADKKAQAPTAPKSTYETLPKSMGMTTRTRTGGQTMVLQYRPNPRARK